MTGRLVKFSFAYDVLDQATVTLEDGREANELRKLNIHEVSLVLYPANPDTSTIEVKVSPDMDAVKELVEKMSDEIMEKAGRRNSAKDEDKLRQIIKLAQECLGEYEDIDDETEEDTDAKSEERDTVNDEERMRIEALIKEADNLLSKEA